MKLRIIPAIGLLLTTGWAHAIVVDGDIADWIGSPTGSASDWQPSDSAVQFWEEDQNTSYLNPGYGGQAYDAEAIYVKKGDTSIDIAIVTGLDPNISGNNAWPSGDIALDFGFPHDAGKPTTENLDRSFEFGLTTLDSATGVEAGSLFKVDPKTGWNYGLWAEPMHPFEEENENTDFRRAHPTTTKEGDTRKLLGETDDGVKLVYQELTYNKSVPSKLGQFNGPHYLIEASIPWDLLLDNTDRDLKNESFLVHWTMACANDFVEVDPPAGSVPTPAPALLLLAGLIPLLRCRR